MKKLYIIRHAKSDWSDESLKDFDRPLNERGEKNAPFMGELLAKNGVIADMILSSPAQRAKTTAEIIAKKIGFEKSVTYNETIYNAYLNELMEILTYTYDNINTLFLIGHNPALNALAYTLVEHKENIPTCGILEIEFNCNSWFDIDKSNAKLISFEYPKKYS